MEKNDKNKPKKAKMGPNSNFELAQLQSILMTYAYQISGSWGYKNVIYCYFGPLFSPNWPTQEAIFV